MDAFDLDGIFVPDIIYNSSTFGLVQYSRMNLLRPIFYPKKSFVLITGRPVCDKDQTVLWLDIVGLKPEKVFHDNLDIKDSAQYKESVLLANPEITRFIESDLSQVDYLRNRLDCEVVWFNDIIQGSLYR